MATTSWGLANTDYDLSDGFVHTAHYTVTRVDGSYSASSYGSCSLTKPDTLTTRTDLTTADIIADVKTVLGRCCYSSRKQITTSNIRRKDSYARIFCS